MSFDELAKYHSLSLMKWDEDFYASENTQLAKAFYEAGQRTKQQEIDLLQDQVKELKENLHNLLSHCKSQENLLTFCDWDKGYSVAYTNVVEDLEKLVK